MATNLLIGYPDIPSRSTIMSATPSQGAGFPYVNLFGGSKIDLAKAGGPLSPTLTISLQSQDVTGNEADFLYIGNAGLLKGSSCTSFALKGATVQVGPYTTVQTVDLTSATLYGPASDDFISIFTPSATYQFWQLYYTNGVGSAPQQRFTHSKVFWGTAFDPGIDPNAPATITKVKITGAERRPKHTFEFSWSGMSYVKAVEMYQKFYRPKKYQPIVLMTRDWHDILMGHRVIFCRITDITLPPRLTDYCDVKATFEEMI